MSLTMGPYYFSQTTPGVLYLFVKNLDFFQKDIVVAQD